MNSHLNHGRNSIPVRGAVFVAALIGLAQSLAAWAERSTDNAHTMSVPMPQISGLWYDPGTSGQGFNLQISPGGLFGFYYGYDDEQPLWLLLDVLPVEVEFGETMTLDALMPKGGVFGVPEGGVAPWGTLTLRFDSCTRAFARLAGLSGTQEFDLVLLAGIDGFVPDCTAPGVPRPMADATGAWYDPATSGQGWNLIQTPGGLVGFFYGHDQAGGPLWLMTQQVLDVRLGEEQTFDLLAGQGGSFTNPVPPAQLEHWGTIELVLDDCRIGIADIKGRDGQQVQALQMLAGVAGVPECRAPAREPLLNDTGIEFCGGASSGNSSCAADHPQGQDAHYGRDVVAAQGQLSKIGGGEAGFDFTKISNSGESLPVDAGPGPGSDDWACTRDNVTGLLWEVKVDDASHFRHQSHRYTWHNPHSPDGQAGVTGQSGTCGNTLGGQACNTYNYAQAVNSEGLCGTSQWRMPTRVELEGIVHYGREAPSIDTHFFANSPGQRYWTGQPRIDSPGEAWAVLFHRGGVDYFDRGSADLVRLVHDDF